MVQVNDVIQLDPTKNDWGPLLVIVTEIKGWGVQGYAIHPEERGRVPGRMFVRVQHDDYVIVGRAEWLIQ